MTNADQEQKTVGILALQGAFHEHIQLLSTISPNPPKTLAVRTSNDLTKCDALIIPGGESTTMALIACRTDLMENLRKFVSIDKKPVWGTCAGMILLAKQVVGSSSKKGGQELIGGVSMCVVRNQWGRQVESFEYPLQVPDLPIKDGQGQDQQQQSFDFENGAIIDTNNSSDNNNGENTFPGVFIRAPVLHSILHDDPDNSGDNKVQIVSTVPRERLPDPLANGQSVSLQVPRNDLDLNSIDPSTRQVSTPVRSLAPTPTNTNNNNDTTNPSTPNLIPLGPDAHIVALRQGKVFVSSFHPELTGDNRMHKWWYEQFVLKP